MTTIVALSRALAAVQAVAPAAVQAAVEMRDLLHNYQLPYLKAFSIPLPFSAALSGLITAVFNPGSPPADNPVPCEPT